MKRNAFLKLSLSLGALLPTFLTAIGRIPYKRRVDKGIKVDAGKDRANAPMTLFEGDTFYTKISTNDTDGDVYLFESSRIKEGGPALHFHYEQDEYWYILQGEFHFKVGEQSFAAKAGDTVFGPRMVPHAFTKVGEGEGKILMFFQPAGKMEDMFRKISEGATKNMTEAEQDQFREEHGIKRVGPPLTNLKKW
ncbi:MAG TPA: cupin domain-containing protein [Chitinophagaceae bacterium]|jgi:mannose-6-phosphate isomerase-like protein (cupin superfamily)|nr:cupin domain-containing protein [Chitinophagaceae bacterium]